MATANNDHRPSAFSLDDLLASEIGEHSNHNVNSPSAKLPLCEALDRIQNGHYAPLLKPVKAALERYGYPSDEYDKFKSRLPVLTFSGICKRERGRKSRTTKPIPCLLLDIDHLPSRQLAVSYRDAATLVPHTVASFLSPSEHGIKIVVSLDCAPPAGDKEAHYLAFAAAEHVYRESLRVEIDQSGKDPARFCYVSHDPDLRRGQGEPLPWRNYNLSSNRTSQPRGPQRVASGGCFAGSTEDDFNLDADALLWVPCPRETGNGSAYNEWLDMVTIQKALSFTPEQVAEWCAGGKAKSCGRVAEILERWDGLNGDDPGLARNRLRNRAHENGWPVQAVRHRQSNENYGKPSRLSPALYQFGSTSPRQDPPDIIMPELNPQPAYPVPPELMRHHAGIHELSGASATATAVSMLSSLALLASEDYDVAWPPATGSVTPIGIFALHLAESGARKTSVWALSFGGHNAADAQIKKEWKKAQEAYQAWSGMSKDERRQFAEDPPGRPKKYWPKALRRDTTPQALVQRFSGGRRTQGLVNGEAGSVISAGTWAMGRENRIKTLADYCELFSTGSLDLDRVRDDVEIGIQDVRLSLAWAVQPKIGRSFIASADAANGFSARTLLSADDRLPDYRGTKYTWEPDDSARKATESFIRLTAGVREGQDSEYEDDGKGKREVISIEPRAEELICTAGEAAYQDAQNNDDLTDHEKSFLVRVGEHAARIAAVLAAYRGYKWDGRGNPVVIESDAQAALEVVRWHYNELRRQTDAARAVEDTNAANWVRKNLSKCVLNDRYKSKYENARRVNHWLGSEASGDAKHLRADPEARERVIQILESHGYIRAVARGAWEVNSS